MQFLIFLIQLVLVILLAPLVSGIISKLKNNLRMRQGQSIFQPYFNFIKLLAKQEVISSDCSWLFKFTPFIVLASSLTALALTPLLTGYQTYFYIGDFLVIIFVLALGRFFLTLAGLDAGSSFGGMGSSREMFISSLAEPITALALFALFLGSKTTNPALIGGQISWAMVISAFAILMVILAETTRIPIDNQETHLELTMIHEAMVLEYSGRSLAFLELASYLKQMVWFLLLSNIICPINAQGMGATMIFIAIFITLAKLFFISLIIASLEVAIAKMRLFRAMDFFGFGFILAIIAVICAILRI